MPSTGEEAQENLAGGEVFRRLELFDSGYP